MSQCCPSNLYPCYYGNTTQSFSKECDWYWPGSEASDVTIPAGTIYTPNGVNCANAIAKELAEYRANALTPCIQGDCDCYRSICVSLLNPDDIQYLEYFTASQGILFSQDVTIIISILSSCNNFGFITTFLNRTGNEVSGGTGPEIKLLGGVIYGFGIGSNVDSLTDPELYTLGWDCEVSCPPVMRVDYATQFPIGIAKCRQL